MTTFLLFLLSLVLCAGGLTLLIWAGLESNMYSSIMPMRPWWLIVMLIGLLFIALGSTLLVNSFASLFATLSTTVP
jgi:hypothetical protein